MAKILNFGSLNVDFVYQVPHFVQPGETLSSFGRSIFAGGKGLNQSLAAARAGAQVFHAGAVGTDGQLLLDMLQGDGVDCSFIQHSEGPSGHTIIQVDPSGQNCIILFQGSNFEQQREWIDAVLQNFSAGDFLLLQNEINLVDYLIDKGAERGLKVCINASPINENLAGCSLEKCSLIAVNELEAAALTEQNPEEEQPADRQLKLLRERFPESSIVLTLGTQGSYLQKPDGKVIFTPAFKVKAVDTTAAGDTFLGFLTAALAEGVEDAQALRRAAAAAAIAVTRPGAGPSIPKLAEVLDFLKTEA